jgi:O-antigen/teichoic acid export membrane protein
MLDEKKSITTIFRGALLILAGFLGGGVMTFGLQIILARFFQPDLYGIFSQGMSVLYVTVMISLLGLNAGISRHISFYERDSLEASKAVGSSLLVVAPFSLIVFSALFLNAEIVANIVFSDPRMVEVLKIFSVAGPAMAVNSILISGFRGHQRSSERVVFLDFFIPFLQIVLVSAVILLGYQVAGAVAGYAFAFVISVFVIGYWYLRKYSLSYSRETLKELIRLSWPLMISAVSVQVFLWSPPILVGIYSASEKVGLFNTALPLASSTKMFLSSIAFLYLPVVSELYGSDEVKDILSVHSSTTRWITYLSVPLLGLFFVHSSDTLRFVFGQAYIEAGLALSIMAAGYFFKSVTGPMGEFLIASGRTRIEMAVNLSGLLFFCTLSIFLIPIYSFIGAAIAYSAGMVLTDFLRFVFFYRDLGFFYNYSFLKPFAAVMASVLLTTVFSPVFPVLVALWVLVYVLVLAAMKPLTYGDYEMISERLSELEVDIPVVDKILLSITSVQDGKTGSL